jgi:hypothetical protein
VLALPSAAAAQTSLHTTASPSFAALALTVHEERRCLHVLPSGERALLKQRFGIGGGAPESDAAIAAAQASTAAAVAVAQQRALQALAQLHRSRPCGRLPVDDRAAAGVVSGGGVEPAAARSSASSSSSGGTSATVALVIAALASLMLVEEIVRRSLHGRR